MGGQKGKTEEWCGRGVGFVFVVGTESKYLDILISNIVGPSDIEEERFFVRSSDKQWSSLIYSLLS